MLIKTCTFCHKEFIPLVGNQKKCNNCKGKRADAKNVLHKVDCIQCGKSFSTLIYNRKFCSKKCRELFHYNPSSTMHTCPVCEKQFRSTKGNKKYCSDLCAHKAKLNPVWRTFSENNFEVKKSIEEISIPISNEPFDNTMEAETDEQ